MRCPSCNKFPAFEIGEPELSLDIEGGIVTGSCRLVLTTQCCGDEAKEANFDVDLSLEDEIELALKAAGIEAPDLSTDGVEFWITEESANGDDRYEDKDRNGMPIKNSRYMKHFYCASVEVTVECSYPNGDKPVVVSVGGQWNDECQASGMDELA